VIAILVALVVVWFLFRHRQAIFDWFFARSVVAMFGLAAVTLGIFTTVAWAGAATWNYTQHENDFCSGCHVMNVADGKMAYGKTKHAKLSCHDCHQQSVFASAHQLYMWISERPEKIEKHANVPNAVCEKCHVTQDTAGWQRIAATAGHRVHLESDSSSLKNVKCVTCHGSELHRFEPVNKTCGTSNCHSPRDTKISIAKMAGQTVRHCTSCHEFTASVPALATRDSAQGTLVPGAPQCLGCHEMKKVLADFNEGKDPHGGKCGMCHNPHKQTSPADAGKTCGNSGCHSNWRDEEFHVGAAHKNVAPRCLTCHTPHSATVDASNCEGCHLKVRERGKLSPPLPFDTSKALRRSEWNGSSSPEPTPIGKRPAFVRVAMASFDGKPISWGHNARPSDFDRGPLTGVFPGVGPPEPAPAERDTFPHARHEKLACLVCHQTGDGHGLLTFERPRGCAICHHQAPSQAKCATCHRTSQYAAPKQMTPVVAVPGHDPKPRPVEFLHSVHSKRQCLECHTTPVSLLPSRAKAECRDCHESHHAVGTTCTTCHAAAQPAASHKSLEASHQRCDACHTAATVALLTPTRSLCSTCHTAKAKGHYDAKECTSCHFLTDPASYRARLTTRTNE
jgi:hypothetical protein